MRGAQIPSNLTMAVAEDDGVLVSEEIDESRKTFFRIKKVGNLEKVTNPDGLNDKYLKEKEKEYYVPPLSPSSSNDDVVSESGIDEPSTYGDTGHDEEIQSGREDELDEEAEMERELQMEEDVSDDDEETKEDNLLLNKQNHKEAEGVSGDSALHKFSLERKLDPGRLKDIERHCMPMREEIHATTQRLLRDTKGASFKRHISAPKPISSVLEKIRRRKEQLSCGSATTRKLPRKHIPLPLENVKDMFRYPSDDNGARDEDDILLVEDRRVMNTNTEAVPPEFCKLGTSFSMPQEVVEKMDGDFDIHKSVDGPEATAGADIKPIPTAPAHCSHDSQDDKKEVPHTSSSEDEEMSGARFEGGQGNRASSLGQTAKVLSESARRMVDDEAEESGEDVDEFGGACAGPFGRCLDEEEEGDLGDDAGQEALPEERETTADVLKRNELHNKWLKEQDEAAEDELLHRVTARPWPSQGSSLGEADPGDFLGTARGAKSARRHNASGGANIRIKEAGIGESSPGRGDFDEEGEDDDEGDADDDDPDEARRTRQRILDESEEQEIFLTPTEDHSSREVLGFISRLNNGPASQSKCSERSQMPEMLQTFGTGKCSGSKALSDQPSFIGRSSKPKVTAVRLGSGNSRSSFVFGRDDSNSWQATAGSDPPDAKESQGGQANSAPAASFTGTSNNGAPRGGATLPGFGGTYSKPDTKSPSILFGLLKHQDSNSKARGLFVSASLKGF